MPILAKRRQTDRERQKRWRRKKLAEGHKSIQLMLSPQAQEVLAREKKRTGEPYVRIINRAILNIEEQVPRVSTAVKVWPPG